MKSGELPLVRLFILSLSTATFMALVGGFRPLQTSDTNKVSPTPAAYDVVSIKPIENPSGNMSWQTLAYGGFRSVGLTINGIIMNAYGVLNAQIANEPSWVKSAQYEIIAKMDGPPERESRNGGVSQSGLEQDVYRQRLQSLLADRFQLRVHTEIKEMAVYALISDRGGPKLKQSTAAGSSSTGGRGRMEMSGASMTDVATQLTNILGRVVVDRTGAAGKYDLDLSWLPDEAVGSGLSGPSIFTAVREQLGLRLDPEKAPVKILVIDHIEKPSPN